MESRRGADMAARAEPSVSVAELAAIRAQARQLRLASRQALGIAVQAHTRATMQSAARVNASPADRGRDQVRPVDSSLARLLQPLLAVERAPARASPEPAGLRPFPVRTGWSELSASLASIRGQVRDLYRDLQGTGAGHLRLVEQLDATRLPQRPRGMSRT
jgi:hypothetical protein